MLEWLMEFLRSGALFYFVVGILFHFFNLDSLPKWIRKYSPLLFGILVNFVCNYLEIAAVTKLILQFLVLLWFLTLNWKQAGLNAAIIGTLMNFSVMIANGGAMPKTDEALEGPEHKFINGNTKLIFLADIILIGNYFLSPGDIVHRIGLLIFFVHQFLSFLKKRL